MLSETHVMSFVNYRMFHNYLPVETGRWSGLDTSQRKCNLYNIDDIGDEFHYIFRCPYFAVI